MPQCGSQTILCGLPVRFDTYSGCSHMCKYCFTQRKINLNNISKCESVVSLKNFIDGKRNEETNWCDWNIPIHFGGLSDPFQPYEEKYGYTLDCLKLFAETYYPFVVSSKGILITKPNYLDLLSECNCVVQISAVCSKYDILEKGAPTFIQRIKMAETLTKRVKRVNIRIQPYMTEIFKDVISNIKLFANAGVYGIIIEGMKFVKKKTGLVKVGGDFVYPFNILEMQFKQIKAEAHRCGLKFYSGENRLRYLGDDMTCCGIDGLDGFKPNLYNVCNILNGVISQPTEKMKEVGTAACFSALEQDTLGRHKLNGMSFHDYTADYIINKREYCNTVFGVKK